MKPIYEMEGVFLLRAFNIHDISRNLNQSVGSHCLWLGVCDVLCPLHVKVHFNEIGQGMYFRVRTLMNSLSMKTLIGALLRI